MTETERNEAEKNLSEYYYTAIQPHCASRVEKIFEDAITALRCRSEAERVKEASINRLTQRNSLGRAVLIQEYMCEGCNDSTWSLGEITDRLAYFEENKSEAERKIESLVEKCKNELAQDYYGLHHSGRHEFAHEILEILEA